MPSSIFSFRHLGVALVTSFGIAALVHCGGAIGEAPACPAQLTGACVSGDVCAEQTTNSCGSAIGVNCHCDSTGWTCDAPPPCKPPTERCGSDGVHQGDSCTAKGATCSTFLACGFKGPSSATCTCDGQQWQCPPISCPHPPPMCPQPGTLHGGESCFDYSQTKDMLCKSGQPYYDCDNNIEGYADCSCEPTPSGPRWMCMNIGMPMCDGGPPTPDASWADASSTDASWADAGK